MNKLLIVDDKSIAIEGLKNLLDWKAYGIQIVGEASDGEEGIALAQSRKPDIIITDIKMPGMNGLDMIKKIRDFNPSIHFIVISGHDDFTLAKKAFQYGAMDYLLKPVDIEQLDKVIKKVSEKIEDGKKEKNEKLRMDITLNKSRILILKEALAELLKGRYESLEAVEHKLSIADVKLGDEPFAVLVITADTSSKEQRPPKEVFKKIENYINSIKFGYEISIDNDTSAVILTAPGLNHQWLRILAEFLYIKYLVNEQGYIIGIGDIYQKLNRMKHSYIEADRAIQYYYLFQSPVIHYLDVQDNIRSLERVDYPIYLEKSIIESLKLGNRGILEKNVNMYFNEINEKNVEITSFKNIMMEMLIIIKKELYSINIDLSDIFIDEFDVIYSIQEKRNVNEVWKIASGFLDKIMSFIEKTSNKGGKQIVQEVLNYIDSNFMSSDISVSEIADKISLTPNYISALVKQVTGENFSDIVVKKRIEKAKELLFDVTLKTYEIAEMVGYTNPNYFGSIFRKVVGMTPAEFRNQFCS